MLQPISGRHFIIAPAEVGRVAGDADNDVMASDIASAHKTKRLHVFGRRFG